MLNSVKQIDRNFVVPNPRNFILKPTLPQDFAGKSDSAICILPPQAQLKVPEISGFVDRLSYQRSGNGCKDLDEEMDCMDVPDRATKCDNVFQTVDVCACSMV